MKPRLTDRVIRGIIASTSFVLSGDPDISAKELADIEAADQWARKLREHRMSEAELADLEVLADTPPPPADEEPR